MPSSELEVFADFCAKLLTTESGQPLVVEDWQLRFLADHFDGQREVIAVMPKKNGKSSICAAVALFHLLTVPEAECVILASSREQAGIVLRQVTGFVRRSDPLRERLVVKQREVEYAKLDGRIRVLAADSATMDGLLPSLAIVDELHRARTSEPYGLLRDGLGPRNGRLLGISTAEGPEICPLGDLRRAVYALPGMVVEGPLRHVASPNLSWFEWRLEDGKDPDDLDAVADANPASWVTVAELEKRRTASMQRFSWLRFACGIPGAQGGDSAIPDGLWRACALPGLEIPAGAPDVFVGIDFALRHDTTALVPVWRMDDGREQTGFLVHTPKILVPPVDGAIEVEDVLDAMGEFADRWPGLTFICDVSVGAEAIAQRAEAELGARVVDHSQRSGPMCLAAQRLCTAVSEVKLRHPDDPELNAHVLAAVARPVGEDFRFSKPRGSAAKIDACIALAMAVSVASTPRRRPRTVVLE